MITITHLHFHLITTSKRWSRISYTSKLSSINIKNFELSTSKFHTLQASKQLNETHKRCTWNFPLSYSGPILSIQTAPHLELVSSSTNAATTGTSLIFIIIFTYSHPLMLPVVQLLKSHPRYRHCRQAISIRETMKSFKSAFCRQCLLILLTFE